MPDTDLGPRNTGALLSWSFLLGEWVAEYRERNKNININNKLYKNNLTASFTECVYQAPLNWV